MWDTTQNKFNIDVGYMAEQEEEIDIFESGLVPKHVILSEDEKSAILKQYNISIKQLPRIKISDPVVKRLSAKKGDIIKIMRTGYIGEYNYYRVVVG